MPPAENRPERHLITRGVCSAENFHYQRPKLIDTFRRAAEAGIDHIQIREKALPAKYVKDLAAAAVDAVKGTPTRIIINERFDIALAAGADGVHITSTGLPIPIVRLHVGDRLSIGVSTHTASEVFAARDGGADYAYFGPVFSTPGKTETKSLAALSDVCRKVTPFRVIAIGGIDAANFESVLENGAAGFATIRYLNDLLLGT